MERKVLAKERCKMKNRMHCVVRGVMRIVSGICCWLLMAAASAWAGFNAPGNILICDQFNNRVIEVDSNHKIVWHFGNGSGIPGPHSVVAPNDARRLAGGFTLITGTGAPAGAEPAYPAGAPDNRVLLVDADGNIVWQYGKAAVTGAGSNELNAPVCAVFMPNNHYLITDQGNQRVIEVNRQKEIVWQYGTTGVASTNRHELNNPNSAEVLPNNNILIADESNNRVIEVNRRKDTVWEYGDPTNTAVLNGAAYASRLPDGNTLITDAGNNRIVEVDPDGVVMFQYDATLRPGSVAQPNPTRAIRLFNGDTIISDQFNQQVIIIDPDGELVFTQGVLNATGTGAAYLNAPYDAKVIGDLTGQTQPIPFFSFPK
jgi:hypothetical protein